MSLRRLNFDADALVAVAVKASGASEGNEIAVIAEGSYNRVFRINFADGKDVIARCTQVHAKIWLPSEVATMDFVRSRLGPRVPKVLAWDASSDNAVGCEYIIMEKCVGPTLHNRVDANPNSFRHIYDVAELMSNLASIPFSQYGSIYYKEDMKTNYLDDSGLVRAWNDVFIEAGALICLLTVVHGRIYSPISAQNQVGARHTAEQHIALLQKWATIFPAVLPQSIYCMPTLSHPDLHADNICVTDADPMSVTSIIDWQSASVLPLFESEMPKFLDHQIFGSQFKYISTSDNLEQPVMPDNFNTLGNEERSQATAEFLQAWPKHAYLKHLSQLHPRLADHEVAQLPQIEVLRRAIYHSAHSWSQGLPALEQMLMVIKYAYGGTFPIHKDYPAAGIFSGEDLEQYSADMDELIEEQEHEAAVMELLQEDGICVSQDGGVAEQDFEAALKKAEDIRSRCIAHGSTERG
ncbi:hypothetical protein HYPSUDRAFT_77307 [Hypholoma sublateritium FD-334 SS-4]|uniref:Altered inheritance of mitochondria protein 9, mitochondrial n=1 Tax=Hypholoma sublateritium (strain FD-334 SS-4) TaxID=945553 RepID=A0A0D2P210_HYPSF|nr:hypothetical protein HYPSUDRAFT_77307 [Hypholoma sublateritium FD-334 SS-4]